MSGYNRPIRVGLIIDEFFGGANTAFGGYGFLARNHIAKYIPNADIQIDVLLGKGSKKLFAEEYL
ncbi:glycosyl transferase, partial [Acinetobacter baumannii]